MDFQESAFAPQSVGLTPFLSKALGPYFTKYSINVHWDAAFDDVAACRYLICNREEDAVNKCYIEAPRTMCRCQGADEACVVIANLSDTPELIRATDATTSEEFLKFIAQVDSVELHYVEPYIPLLGRPWAFLASPVGYGYGMERAIALACVGDDAVWLPLSQSLVYDLSSLQTGDQNEPSKNLQWACRAAKIDGKVATSYASLVSSGQDTNIQVEYLKLSLLSHAMKRPLVMLYEGLCKQTKAAIAVPELHDPAACQACPIVVIREMGDAGLTWSALIPFRAAGAPLLLTCVKLSQMVHLCEAGTAVGRYVAAANDTLVVFTPDERCDDGIAKRLRNECTALRAGENLTGDNLALPPWSHIIADTPEAASEQLDIPGFGRDDDAALYLRDVLRVCDNVAPLAVDDDGNSLFHAVSCALVGRPYLWHALRSALHLKMESVREKDVIVAHFSRNAVLGEIIKGSINELAARANPEAGTSGFGLEHIFCLSNLLRRPIILLDSLTKTRRESYFFLPLLLPREKCSTVPIVISWGRGDWHNYVPLVQLSRTRPATIAFNVLPYIADKPDVFCVYGCPDDVHPNALVERYVKVRVSRPEPLSISGGLEFDVRPWCAGIMEEFRKEKGVHPWALHEAMLDAINRQALSPAQLQHSGNDVASITETLVSAARKGLKYCALCTKTWAGPSCGCRHGNSQSLHRAIIVNSGVVMYVDGDRLPVKAELLSHDCVFKHWVAHNADSKGSQVCARKLTSFFSPATVVDICEQTGEVEVEFRDGSRRCCVPLIDILGTQLVVAVIEWESLDPLTGQWIAYQSHVSEIIERAFAAGERSVSVEIGISNISGCFTINFSLMQQQSMQMGNPRKIRRIQIMDAVAVPSIE